MRLAYIGNFGPEYSTENDVCKAWNYLGHEVIQLQENRLDWATLESYDYDLLLITGTWDDANPLIQMFNIFKSCAELGIPTATLHLDTFWSTSRNGRRWWLHPMFHTAYIFTADGDYQNTWQLFGKNHIWLPPAVRHDACHKGVPQTRWAVDVGFVGSNGVGYHETEWPYRRELLQALREICGRNGWTFLNPGGDYPKIPRDDQMNNFYASCKVTVGDSLCLKREQSHYFSDRQMETWGRHGFLIMPQIDYLDEIMEGKQPMYQWGDWDDLEDKIGYWLANEQGRLELVEANAQHVKQNHTYVNRVTKILKETIGE